MNSPEMLPRQAPQLSVKEIDGQTIVLDRTHGKLHELNATAGFVWRHCDGRASVAQIVAATAREFGTDPAIVERDIAALLRQFSELKLIEWSDTPA